MTRTPSPTSTPPPTGSALSADEFQGRVRLAALGAAGLLAAGAYAAAAAAGTGVAGGGVLLAMPALYAVGVSGAAVFAYLLYARARVGGNDRLRWMGRRLRARRDRGARCRR